MHLSHIGAMALVALLISVALGCLAQRGTSARLRQVLISFLLFMAVGLGIAWLMYPFSR